MRFAVLTLVIVLAACAVEQPHYQPPQSAAFTVRQPVLAYNYRTETERVKAHQAANDYCGSFNSEAVANNGVDNVDGSQTINFQCNEVVLPPPGTGTMPVPIP
jgi:hypothetical protein